jgi:hypothetical protein
MATVAKILNVRSVLSAAFAAVGVEWHIIGIIDGRKKIYTISDDTKLISKVFELVSVPIITKAVEPFIKSWEIEERQTVYPDLTLILNCPSPNKIAIDIKSTYRKGFTAGFTLGSYTAYMRSPFTKNIRYRYQEYVEHWIVGFIYDRVVGVKPEIINIGQMDKVIPPIENVEVIIWQKWQVASDKPGSGNTANIGSVRSLEALRNGQGVFVQFGNRGKEVFEDYWRNYDWRITRKYTDLSGYLAWKKSTSSQIP